MPGYFASQKYKTFQRSLNLWGFESVSKGPERGACYHQYFVKGHPELCHSMYVQFLGKREKPKVIRYVSSIPYQVSSFDIV